MYPTEVFVLFVALILYVHCDEDSRNNETVISKGLTTPPIPPKLSLKKTFEEIGVNSTFEVECIGNRPINWIVSHRYNLSGGKIVITESFDADKRDFPYSSKLILTNAEYVDTSLYTCHYNVTKLNQPFDSTSIYLYVNDEEHLLTPVYQVIKSTPSEVLEIPCRATNSKANVTLWKQEGQDDIMVNLEEDIVHYEPQRGFVIFKPHLFYSGSFYCKAVLDNIESQALIILSFTPSIDDMQSPIIKEEDTEHAKISSRFSLNCYIDIDMSRTAHLTWSYPGKSQGNSTGRYLVTKSQASTYKAPGSTVSVNRIQSRLTVLNAQKIDEGYYICTVTKDMHETSAETVVKIRGDELDPYINITMTPDRKYIAVAEKTSAKMVFELTTSFSRKDLMVKFYKNDNPLTNSIKFNISNSLHRDNGSVTFEEILTINSVTRKDSGNYTIVAEVGDYQEKKMVSLFVKATPIAFVENELGYYNSGQRYTLYCVVDGFPKVNVFWKWRKCDDYDVCQPLWSDMDNVTSWDNYARVNDVNKTLPYKPQRSLEVTAKQSGEYLCLGSKNLITDEIVTRFKVTDVEGGFGITASSSRIIQGDDVQLTCKAHLFEFSNISWYIVDSNDEKQPLEYSENEWQIIEGKTPYSLLSIINVTNIKNANETLICVGRRFDKLNTSETNYTLVVLRAVKPHFLSNQTTTKLDLEVGRSGTLDCASEGVPQPSVTWSKNGRPVQNSNIMSIGKNGQILHIRVALKANVEGTYKCEVRNRMGRQERTFNVYVEDHETVSTETIALAVILPIIIIMFLIVAFCWIRRIRKEREEKAELKALSQELFNKGEIELLNPDMALDDQVELLPYDHRWEFPKERLKMGRILGQGAFGRVVKAEAIGLEDEGSTTVAVKMLKERADKTQRKALVAELKILIHLGKHLNIVNLHGAVTKNMMKGELLVMVEYCRYGNLRNYLLKRKNRFINQLDPETGQVDPDLVVLPGSPVRTQLAANQGLSNPIYGQKVNYADLLHENNSGNSYNVSVAPNSADTTGGRSGPFRWLSVNDDENLCQPITTCDLLCYSFQVARGMQYLSSRKLLHRDLAARNVLLADDNVVKICDFGLAKDCYNYDTYRIQGNGPLPIKWMALESLSDKVYTIKSDVWSFGILLWEFFTLGGDPYPGVDLDEEFFKRLKGGYRMDKPDYAPNNVYRIMLHCWNSQPENRPDFETLGDLFGDFLQASVKEFYLELDNQYADMNLLHKPTDYLAMSDSNYLTMNHDDDKGQTVNYDNVNCVRPVDNGPVLSDPMLAVPMIQLEPINVRFKVPKNKGRPAPETPVSESDNSKRETDYLMMDNSAGDTKSFSRQRKGNESLRSDASSGFHSDLDTSAENSAPPSYNLVMDEERIGIEV